MKTLKLYYINILSLSNGDHCYNWDIDNTFFEALEEPIVEKGLLKVHVDLVKSERMIVTNFHIVGEVELVCDRSLEIFNFPIDTKNSIYFKYSDEYKEVSDDVIHIPQHHDRLNLAQLIYELIGLQIPIKKLHPKFSEEEIDDEDSEETMFVYSNSPSVEDEEVEEEKVDPRWAALKKLKN